MIKPVFTEKSMGAAKNGKYTFWVGLHSTKPQIKQLIKDAFSVDVVSVSTIKIRALKHRNMYGRYINVPAAKKAIVSLKKGQTIGLFEEKKADSPKKSKKTKKAEK